jgi:hypothetical protein
VTLLKSNSELRADRVFNWTLPAWVVRRENGKAFNVCPSAGACKDFCYARNGTYLFSNVRAAHLRNLEMILDDIEGWKAEMINELQAKRFRPTGETRLPHLLDELDLDTWCDWWARVGGAAVRIHDSGDFFSDEYLEGWMDIAREVPDVLFYAYTKEVSRCKRLADATRPTNFRLIFSLGGVEDHLIDLDADRHAEVFTSIETLEQAGYTDQEESDLLCVLLPTNRVGVPANNIKHFLKRMGNSTFGDLETARREKHGKA